MFNEISASFNGKFTAPLELFLYHINVLWGPRGPQAHGFKSCPRSECRLGFLTLGNGFLAGGLSDRRYPKKYPL
ncbi:hypothetical protein E2C01_054117 [Portunus trituberculatus]|uniref:Uncharacterized protein n=1 Tax=Portunus trituberculatus TaxID=210409 RepID=A0A5B7GJ12_PORTR|nr:hypothetical protein [Portunus trituberculatus]